MVPLRTTVSVVLAVYLSFIFHNQEAALSKEGHWCQLSAQMSAGATQCICTDGALTFFPLNGGTMGEVKGYTSINTPNEPETVDVTVGDEMLHLFKTILLTYKVGQMRKGHLPCIYTLF